jgi:hypothetical protein
MLNEKMIIQKIDYFLNVIVVSQFRDVKIDLLEMAQQKHVQKVKKNL